MKLFSLVKTAPKKHILVYMQKTEEGQIEIITLFNAKLMSYRCDTIDFKKCNVHLLNKLYFMQYKMF